MDVIAMSRVLAKAVQQEGCVIAYNKARARSDADETLQGLIGEFNLKRIELNDELKKEDKDNERVTALDGKIREIYSDVMSNPNMAAYNEAKGEVDRMMSFVNTILAAGINGEDPDTVEENTGCGGSCSDCSGCH